MSKSHAFRTAPERIQGDVLEWYAQNQRILPWRSRGSERGDPYRVWLSEIMLQQTTVPAVAGYFQKFTEKWPDVQSLAAAADEEVMAAWAGLGYYARARNLLKCARIISCDYGGRFPQTVDGLLALPGVGPYTAAAIAAIAFSVPATVVDGNIERIVARVLAITEPLPQGKKVIRSGAEMLFSGVEKFGRPAVRDFPQALMDIGADVCTPKSPKCTSCPLISVCQAYRQGEVQKFPAKAPKKTVPLRRGRAYWICDEQGRVLLERRADDRMLGGMVGLPSTDWDRDKSGDAPEHSLIFKVVAGEMGRGVFVGRIYHVFTHFRLELDLWSVTVPNVQDVLRLSVGSGYHIAELSVVQEAGFPTVFMKAVNMALGQNSAFGSDTSQKGKKRV